MKKLIAILLFLPFLSNAQSLIGGKNVIKGNLSAYALGNYGLTYERKILPHITLSLGVSKMPSRSIPFRGEIQSLSQSSVIDYENSRVANLTITPELRFYVLGAMRGFYLAPYARYSSMDLFVPLKYSNSSSNSLDRKADFSGTITAMSGGLMLGTQHQLFKKVVIDIWILGAHYGSAHGDINARYTPTDSNPNSETSKTERMSILKGINSLNPPLVKISNPTVTQDDNNHGNAHFIVDGPWAGIRAVGINVGIRF